MPWGRGGEGGGGGGGCVRAGGSSAQCPFADDQEAKLCRKCFGVAASDNGLRGNQNFAIMTSMLHGKRSFKIFWQLAFLKRSDTTGPLP